MAEELMELFEDTLHLLSRYGDCMVKDHNDIAKECWEEVLPSAKTLCDMAEKQTTIHGAFRSYMDDLENIEKKTPENAGVNVIKRFHDDVARRQSKVQFGLQNRLFTPFLPTTRFLCGVEGKEDEDDDDEVAMEQEMNVIDPITKLRITNPVKNTTCNHVYERSAVYELLERKRWIKCPVPGCPQRVVRSYLAVDKAMKAYLKKNP